MSDAAPLHAAPADVVDQLHAKVTEMCEAYFTSIGHLQSVAPPLSAGASPAAAAATCAEPAGTFAADVVRLHGEFENLVGELEAEHRSEREQLDAMADLQARGSGARGSGTSGASAMPPLALTRLIPRRALRCSSTRPTRRSRARLCRPGSSAWRCDGQSTRGCARRGRERGRRGSECGRRMGRSESEWVSMLGPWFSRKVGSLVQPMPMPRRLGCRPYRPKPAGRV
jgi:hypothetical protein